MYPPAQVQMATVVRRAPVESGAVAASDMDIGPARCTSIGRDFNRKFDAEDLWQVAVAGCWISPGYSQVDA